MKLEKTTEFVVVSGWVMMMICCFAVIGVAVYDRLGAADAFLADLAKVAFGFAFGSLPLMIKDLLLQKATPPVAAPPQK